MAQNGTGQEIQIRENIFIFDSISTEIKFGKESNQVLGYAFSAPNFSGLL